MAKNKKRESKKKKKQLITKIEYQFIIVHEGKCHGQQKKHEKNDGRIAGKGKAGDNAAQCAADRRKNNKPLQSAGQCPVRQDGRIYGFCPETVRV